ncbi:MAG: bifunctional hydroxymethylpyrimidine kinase/phosphomethylpyrimidine kinase [Euryarchaeota archaeon]|nr:bifunctional hydroxymethylpyrimidine kinase/phosphomethylpyrimidine kinase [Euryarchaeota archaeon]
MTRQYAPVSPPVALTIAGSDSGGGAGIQADLKTMEAHDTFGTSVVTATTAQNTTGVQDVHVLPPDHIEAQYQAVVDDFAVEAIKTGMLASEEVIETVADCIDRYGGPLVVDPVMVAATGDRLLSEDAEDAYNELIARSTLVTPNIDEAEILTGTEIDDQAAAKVAATRLVEQGADAALVKGGHLDGDEVVDTLVVGRGDDSRTERFSHPRIETAATHGSGCTLSSAIAARVAAGESLSEAVAGGAAFMERAVRYGIDVGSGSGSVHHMVDIRERADRVAVSEAVESVVARLVDRNVETLVPDIGMGVVGATRYAETPAEVVGVDGRLSRTRSGIRPTAGVRSGGSRGLARQLVAARETHPELRFAVNCRFDSGVESALAAVDGPVVEAATADQDEARIERVDHTAPVVGIDEDRLPEGDPPAAVVDRGGEGREPGVVLFASDSETLLERTLTLYEALITE